MSDYEANIKLINEISEKLSSGDLSIEKSLELYAQGIDLIKHSSEILKKAELKITEISSDTFKINEDLRTDSNE